MFTTLAVITSLIVYSPGTCVLCFIPQILIIAICATFAEVISIGWTDNFLIPVITALSMWLLIFPGIPLFVF